MKNSTKAWILFALVLIIAGQLTFLGSFYSVNTFDQLALNRTLVVMSKQEYVYARFDLDIGLSINAANGQTQPVMLIFSNGTRTNITSDYSSQLVFPSSGNYFGNSESGGLGVNISQSHPLDAEVVSNISSFDLSSNGTPFSSEFTSYYGIQVYWVEIIGQAEVTVQGYGLAF